MGARFHSLLEELHRAPGSTGIDLNGTGRPALTHRELVVGKHAILKQLLATDETVVAKATTLRTSPLVAEVSLSLLRARSKSWS